jgi:predicted butyrate kinase (DUF1464 family)
MPRVVGIDPGTVSFDLCGLDDGVPFLERSVPSSEFAARPEVLLDLLREAGRLDLIAGPSGYGLPLVPIETVGDHELRLLCLAEPGEGSSLGGLRSFVRLLREARLPVVFTPGAIHLPTVPAHRKVNRIDIGTADKVCMAALGIETDARRLGVPHREVSFVLAECGGAFTAVLSVEGGSIVSGQGGSSGPLGYRAAGALDGELAFLLGGFPKDLLFSGGAAFVAGDPGASAESVGSRTDAAAGRARDAYVEGLVKAVAGELALVEADRILLSGRLSRVPGFREPLLAALSRLAPVRDLVPGGTTKEAARGAALVADGLLGGRHAALVESMRLREARGTALDHLYVTGADAVRRWAGTAS